jgi:hypothetical protein
MWNGFGSEYGSVTQFCKYVHENSVSIKKQGISLKPEQLLASQEGLWSMQLEQMI